MYSNYTCPSLSFRVIKSTQEVLEEVLLNVRFIVKGYHLCRFEVNVGEVFTASKKRREHGSVFKVVNHRGQLGHLQAELVDPVSSYAAVVGNFIVCQCRTSVTRVFL